MTFVSHLRMSALGTLPGGEIFSFGLALDQVDRAGDPWQAFLDPSSGTFDDLAADLKAFWLTTPCDDGAILERVKFASIGPDGRYTSAPVERVLKTDTNTPLAGPVGTSGRVPNQVALACTLHTAGDLNRVKGRFYLPRPSIALGLDGIMPTTTRDSVQNAVAAFVNNVNNEAGIDALNLHVVVASQGRRDKAGVIRVQPANHKVTGVSVGRALDTIRTRRNALSEARSAPAAVS